MQYAMKWGTAVAPGNNLIRPMPYRQEVIMDIRYLKTSFAVIAAALMLAPGGLAARQLQSPQSANENYGQPAGDSPAQSGEPDRSYPGGVTAGPGDASLASVSTLTPQQVEDMEVVDSAGEKIGKVDELVRSRQDGLIYAVVSSGGVLGIGADKIPVPLQDLQRQADSLHIGIAKEALRNWPRYHEDQYVELKPSNQPISEFAAFEMIPHDEKEKAPESSAPPP